MTGAAPVPVPPPIPAATKTKLAPSTICLISSLLASAAFFPTLGSPPAPNPLVTSFPIVILFLALLKDKACLSVFKT